MRIFSLTDANHYCRSFAPVVGDAENSVKSFFSTHITGTSPRVSILREGSVIFNEFRACSLRDAERCLFFSISQYRRCLDLMTPSGCSWALVTTYYGSFYAAQALLAMFGGRTFTNHVIDVRISRRGSQELSVRNIGSGAGQEPTTFRGSHQRFWDFFYRAFNSISSLIPAHLLIAVTPISNQIDWQPKNRNDINYDSYNALELSKIFNTSYNPVNFPTSLPGVLNTQFSVFEATLELAFYYAKQFGLRTDALNSMGSNSLKQNIKNNIYHFPLPKLVAKTKKNLLVKGLN